MKLSGFVILSTKYFIKHDYTTDTEIVQPQFYDYSWYFEISSNLTVLSMFYVDDLMNMKYAVQQIANCSPVYHFKPMNLASDAVPYFSSSKMICAHPII